MGKKVRNLLGTLLLVMAIAVTQIPVTDVEAVTTASASDFQMDGTTLVKYNGTAENVSVSNYVERIEANAFAGNYYVKTVTIGDAVESIGASAFAGCDNLQKVTIPDCVVNVDTAAFSRCPSLREVSVGTGLSRLGNGAFAGDYSLQTVAVSSSNPKFTCDDGAIYNKDGRDTLYQVLAGRKGDTYQMPSTIKEIKPYAFWGDYNLTNISVSSNVDRVPEYSFSNCKNLKVINLPYSVKNIDLKAFEDCVRLREITIPSSVSTIHSTAFDGCTKLNIIAEPGSTASAFAETLVLEDIDVSEYEEAPIPGSEEEKTTEESGEIHTLGPVDYYHEVTHIDPLESQDDSVKGTTRIVGQQAFVLIDNAQAKVRDGSTGEALGGSDVEEDVTNLDTVPGLAGSDDAKGGSFPKYTIVNNKIIAAQAYYDDSMSGYSIPSGIERIGEFAFARAELQSINIPDGVKEIGYAAFYHCDQLTDVVIPQSVESIEPSAFAKTAWLDGWTQNVGNGNDFLIVGDGILLAYRGNSSIVTIPGEVKQIGAEAFRGHSEITSVILPDSVTVIGEAAFAECSGLAAVGGGNAVKEIRDRAFAGCPIKSVKIPASVEQIGLLAFDSADTAKGEENSVIVFEGQEIPKLSYETTATKLYRDGFRDQAFKGNEIAVVPEELKLAEFDDTVLTTGKGGFEGAVCVISREPTEGESGALQVIQKSVRKSYAGNTYYIDGRAYTVEKDDLISNTQDWLSNESNAEGTGIGTVTVQISSSTLPLELSATAVMEGSEEDYILSIVDSREVKNEISAAYKKIYGNQLPGNLCGYEISLTDKRTGIPITALGKQEMTVTVPIPLGVTKENLHVVCLDADGQLEEVDSRIVSPDGGDYVSFTARHFSPYGIYNYTSGNTSVANVNNGQAVFNSLGKKDASPDTGDHSIHPKWFLMTGLFFASMAMFFYRGGRKHKRLIRRK